MEGVFGPAGCAAGDSVRGKQSAEGKQTAATMVVCCPLCRLAPTRSLRSGARCAMPVSRDAESSERSAHGTALRSEDSASRLTSFSRLLQRHAQLAYLLAQNVETG